MTDSSDPRPARGEKSTTILPILAPDDATDPFVGREIDGRYRIVERIGRGGMSWVYRAVQVAIGREVALKVLRPERQKDDRHVRQFEAEARMAGALEHPNAVTVHDAGRFEDGTHFLAMDLVGGCNLRELLEEEGALPENRVRAIGRQVADAMAEAHRRGFVHSDLKPENVMVEKDRMGHAEWVQVLDFGIAVPIGSHGATSSSAAPGLLVGTPRYMSPEQCRGEVLDPRSDVYSIGVLLYEMLLGEPPFHGGNVTTRGLGTSGGSHGGIGSAVSVMAKHVQGGVPSLRERRPDLDLAREFEKIVMRALSKDPNWRYRDAEEMLEAFDRLHHLDTAIDRAMVRPRPEERTAPRARRDPEAVPTRRIRPLTVGMLSIAVVAGASLYLAFLRPASESPGPAASSVGAARDDALPSGSGPAVLDVGALLDQAREELRAGRPAAASEIYDRVRRLEPNQVEAWVGLGRSARGMRQPDRALFYFDRARKIAQESSDPRWRRHLQEAHREEQAIRGLDRALREARAAERAGEAGTALERYRVYVDGRPWDLPPRITFGRLLVDQGFVDEGIEELSAVARQDPMLPEPHFELGLAWMSLDEFSQAEMEFGVALRLDPGSEEARRRLEAARLRQR